VAVPVSTQLFQLLDHIRLIDALLGDRDFVEKLKRMKNAVIKGSAKDHPSYRMMQSVEAKALIKQAADYFWFGEADLTRKRGQHRQERALVMELLHRYSGLKQRRIGARFGRGVGEPGSQSDPGKDRD
jgi:hypothetical protein